MHSAPQCQIKRKKNWSKMDQSHGHLLGGMPHMLPGDHRERDALQKDWNTRWRGLAGSLPTTGKFEEYWHSTPTPHLEISTLHLSSDVLVPIGAIQCCQSSYRSSLDLRDDQRWIQLSHPTIDDVCSQVVNCLRREHLVSTCSTIEPSICFH